MGRPRQLTDESLDAAAREVFLELGPAAPVADVARRLGVTQAALFHRAGSKETLMLRALCPGAPAALSAFAEPPRAELHAHLKTTLVDLLAFLDQAIPGLVVLRGAGIPLEKALGPFQPPPLAMREALTHFLSVAVERGFTTLLSPSSTAEAVLGALEARALNRYLGGPSYVDSSDDEFIDRLLSLIPPGPKESR